MNLRPGSRFLFFYLVCGGGKYLTDKHLQRFGPPEFLKKQRSLSAQAAPGSRAKSGQRITGHGER